MTSHNAHLSAKLSAPMKKSVFERQKAEAEAKKAREQAETAAVLEDFVKSFDDDEGEPSGFPSRRPGHGGGGGGGGGGAAHGHNANYGPGPGKRHFTSSGLKSGPGSLGPPPSLSRSGPGSLGPVPGYGKKRHFDDYSGGRDRDRERERRDKMFSYEEERSRNGRQDSGAFGLDEEAKDAEDLMAAAKPTLHLSSLPPGTSPAVIKSLFAPSPLTVDNVRILPAAPGPGSDRRSVSAIVTLAAETPATDIDTTVSHLQNKYLGFGFNLSISRHLSSAALTGAGSLSNNKPSASLNSLPFGARPIPQHTSLSRAPPPGHHGPGRFAPPPSYTSSTPYGARPANFPPTQVTVQAPNDLKQLRLIHKTVEALLTFGPEFEALLMSRPEIQRDEQWAWLWDSRSAGGVYYRWRLWEILTNFKARKGPHAGHYGSREQGDVLFEGQSVWVPPDNGLKFEYVTKVEDLVSDDDYNSSDEEDMDDGGGLATRYRDHQKLAATTADPAPGKDGMGYLNPLAKTKLVHLLSRLPESNAKLRKGDVARVTGFAIEHAGAGAEEVAALLTRNVIKPFCYHVNKKSQSPSSDEEKPGDDEMENDGDDPNKHKDSPQDTTPASLVGLYVISDILSSSASAGVRHAWRYRSLFETQLRVQNVFPILGRAARDLNWGKLKAEKWRRSIQSVLGLWEGWCVFPGQTHEAFVEGFLNPPLTERELKEKEKREAEEKMERMREREKEKAASRWRSVEADQAEAPTAAGEPINRTPLLKHGKSKDEDGDVNMDMDGTPMTDEDEDDNLTDANLDGVPMDDSSDEEAATQQTGTGGYQHLVLEASEQPSTEPGLRDDPTEASEEVVPSQATAESTPSSLHASKTQPPPTAATVGQGRKSRLRAVDFDDMFE
ncbi:hypothetical protein A1O1_04723 [Capronia coronata CBS 617.96]|uniref:CID domain-containing protein n=1 Tax=Capronia coronata CBS 617.96 TaxID=1182541 RepID=W9YEV8_9EURO|nr:uncharacterized protein A1O1_04723 [Capronia coronata CBS 617.96]EXJ87796.1 hypothetical protein A1O1_04723 [Capronia coronata CBS 617.96]